MTQLGIIVIAAIICGVVLAIVGHVPTAGLVKTEPSTTEPNASSPDVGAVGEAADAATAEKGDGRSVKQSGP